MDMGLSLAALTWLAGCWQETGPQGVLDEYWTVPKGGTMIGMGRQVAGSETPFHEWMLLAQKPDGKATLSVWPYGQTPIEFDLLRTEGQSAFFRTQKGTTLSYRRTGDTLDIRLTKPQEKALEFHLKSADCARSLAAAR